MLKITLLRKPVQETSDVPSRVIQKKSKPTEPATLLHPLLRLQQTAGNQAVGRLIQAKPKVGRPGDKYEQEADRGAEQVMRVPVHGVYPSLASTITPLVQRQSEEVEEANKEKAIRTRSQENEREIPDLFQSRLLANYGGGQPLPKPTREFMKTRFGADFSDVRVHTDSQAQQMNHELKAQAFTWGRDIYFGAGKYQPESNEGKRLLAHELTHTIQQRAWGSAVSRAIQLAPVPASINGVTMTKASSVVDTNLKDVVTDVLDKSIKSTMDGVALNAIYISSVNDGGHASNSRHFKDLAIDMSRLKTSGATNWQFMSTTYPSNADVKKVVEALQNGFEGEVGTPGVRENFGPYIKKKNGADHSVGGHGDHIHISCNE